ncbi:hypothetical protein [Arthrobacter methylotrophus]|uniref:hypothetical protein n=1 Tax=Arthrobacter methylotrophus TaxID=121291 RepID=UPI0031EE9C73
MTGRSPEILSEKHDGNPSVHRPPQAPSPPEQDTTDGPPSRGEAPVKHIVDRAGRRIEKQGAKPLGKHHDTIPTGPTPAKHLRRRSRGSGAATDNEQQSVNQHAKQSGHLTARRRRHHGEPTNQGGTTRPRAEP